jgi:hypothetical protein
MGKGHVLVVLLLSSLTEAACFYPIHKTIQPAAEITVIDEMNVPIEGASVALIAGYNPHGWLTREIDSKTTDQNGRATFERRGEWQRENPFLMHGVRYYFWDWSVRKRGEGQAINSTSGRMSGSCAARRRNAPAYVVL